ncbi:hypothetical protein V500_03630 [Pseudogymnoascus sp. VKM F-4518 (FW-2643)]|nr:hypothetical protein V500_03630 [Pseudogymnoascus sp. VKM F-4518 (FW-2643)]
MASGGLEEHATDQEALDGRTLADPNCIELPPTPRSQLRPSGLSEDDTHDSGDGEGRCDIEEVNQWQTSSRAEYESGVEEENQEGGNKADDANQTDRRKPESGNQDDDNEADESNRGSAEDIYLQDRRAHYIAMMGCGPSDADRRAVQSYFATMAAQPAELIEFGDSISHYSIFPFPFSRSFLEIFTPDELLEGASHIPIRIKTIHGHEICPLIFSDNIPNQDPSHLLHVPVDLHITCSERQRSINRSFEYGKLIFHTTFFELQQPPTEPDSWVSGRLYSLGNAGGKPFRKACITIICDGSKYARSDRLEEWTIAILAPSKFFVGPSMSLDLKFPALYSDIPYDTMLRVITQSVEIIVDHWQKLYDEVRKECDDGNVSFMDGEKYVHLLYDDGTFRRSRFHFWAIGCLSSFEQSVAETLWELDRFRTEVDDKSKPGIRVASETQGPKNIYKQEMEDYDQAKKNLEGIRDQLAKKRDEMKVLRDGLFSASSVMESRQSRILGENVQLLAFVTIFFLPLAFSASLWSIPGVNEKYPGVTIPGAFAAVVGFITYFIVFNLNLLISGLRRLFAVPRGSLLTRMMNDNDDSEDYSKGEPEGESESAYIRVNNSNGKRPIDWPKIAKAFEVFPRQDEGLRPSNWLLLFYAIRLLVLKAFDLVIGLLAWLRGVIASDPSDQDPDTEKADRAASRVG